ncbi:hypothetical protein [Streptomyces clavuligerus]|nr:hypothetical protein [Streptomyces clavuligerus]WDN52680.1 hypothetical protein LL058_12930 [Streptomyces clavuligerus]
MRQRLPKLLSPSLVTLVLALATSALWAAWLGWDQQRDVHPDGSTTGPYQPWQVIGLVLTLLPLVYAGVSRRHLTATVLGIPFGLAAAAFHDWSDDGSGLFAIGVLMVLVGSLVATGAAAAALWALTASGTGRPAAPAAE